MTRRDFGSIRKLPSGRWQARYRDRSGQIHPRTFATRGDAARFLAGVRADLDRGEWISPRAGTESLAEYAERWIENRRVRGRPLAPQTRDLYAGQLKRHILPTLGRVQLRYLDVATVRAWHAGLTAPEGPGTITVAKCYRLLHAICASAVADEQIPRNPCAIPGAGIESSPERPVATVGQVYELAEAVPDRYRAFVLLATFCGLRFAELAALTRDRLDLLHGTVTVAGDVKSEASKRTVSIPAVILPDLERHLATYAETGRTGLVFVGPKGGRLRRSGFGKVWRKVRANVGVPELHVHDLRHTGNTLAAATGASTKELMARMGHATARAALIYQHATADRDAAIAAALSDLVSGTTGERPNSRPAVVRLVHDRDRGMGRGLA